MADDRPVLNQINLVVRDMDAMTEFYGKLGAEIAPTAPPWDRHHRTLSMPDGLDFDLDSTEFVARWNRGWPLGQTGPVVGFRVASREAVDRIYEDLRTRATSASNRLMTRSGGTRERCHRRSGRQLRRRHESRGAGPKDSSTNAVNRVAQNFRSAVAVAVQNAAPERRGPPKSEHTCRHFCVHDGDLNGQYGSPVYSGESKIREGSMALADGGSVSYTEAGAPDGFPILYFHGAPGSRLDAAWLDNEFSNLGTRVVSADRPGIGGSSPSPGRAVEDWPRRIADLADRLGIDRFGVMGLSSGGPYVVACAALLPDRVVGAAVVAGVTDMGWSAAFDDFPEDDEKTIMRIGDEEDAQKWCAEHYGQDGSRFFDSPMDLSPPDAKVMEDEVILGGLLPTFF